MVEKSSASTVEFRGDSLLGEVSSCADDLLAVLRGGSALTHGFYSGFHSFVILAF